MKIEAGSYQAFTPTINDYTYWKKKTQFLLETDQYEHWTMFAVEEGSFWFEIETESATARFGDLVLIPPNTPMTRRLIEPLTFHFVSFAWEDSASPRPLPSRSLVLPTSKVSIFDEAQLRSCYASLRKLKDRIDPVSCQWRNIVLADLFYSYFNENQLELKLFGSSDPLIEKAAVLIHEALFTPFNIMEIAAKVGLSPVQFSRRFFRMYGMTPNNYITSLRVERGKILLQETQFTLDRIAENCGYMSGYYFSRVFTKHMGMSPSQYRKLHR
ncbi:AraC family transcriptional regulator [Paenibacillus pasadenensis]|uniref:AraC family transcriptional regulator n=1 Tax=Paenibacillus pasadenensis TaxID=217090 RepID=UPI00203C407A|nr:AraC family transcriptional regulator [Paenibacillus pasadenensis]MCM3748839.1 AraC family transcriptional regulator [Paenibacillus pasadenensis]